MFPQYNSMFHEPSFFNIVPNLDISPSRLSRCSGILPPSTDTASLYRSTLDSITIRASHDDMDPLMLCLTFSTAFAGTASITVNTSSGSPTPFGPRLTPRAYHTIRHPVASFTLFSHNDSYTKICAEIDQKDAHPSILWYTVSNAQRSA